MTYQIFHCIDRDRRFNGTPPDGPLDTNHYLFIAAIEAEDLEDVFRKMNVVDGTELPVKLRVRSLSCGDVVVEKGGRVMFCASSGWTPVEWAL